MFNNFIEILNDFFYDISLTDAIKDCIQLFLWFLEPIENIYHRNFIQERRDFSSTSY